MLSLGSKLAVAEGGDVDGDEVADEWEPGVPITSPCDSVMVSEGYARKEGVKQAAQACTVGGGGEWFSHIT
jgi:hypothetical protein